MNKLLIAAGGAMLLAGCQQDAAPPEPAPSDTATTISDGPSPMATTAVTAEMLVGTWDDTLADGTKTTTTFTADGKYSDADGSAGTYEVKDGKACLTGTAGPDSGKTNCWTLGAPGGDGSMPATADDGTAITVKKRA